MEKLFESNIEYSNYAYGFFTWLNINAILSEQSREPEAVNEASSNLNNRTAITLL